jgi:hypothetical protein
VAFTRSSHIREAIARFVDELRAWLTFFGGRIVVIAAWIVITEMVLQVMGLPFEEQEGSPETAYGRFDSELGWAYLPGLSIEKEFGSEGRRIPIFFDSIGSRVASPDSGRGRSLPSGRHRRDIF